MPSLEHEILNLYNISSSQYSLIFTSPFLLAALGCVFGGILGDRYGTRSIVGIGALLIGVLAIARTLGSGFMGLFVPTILFGLSLSFIIPNLPKIISVWFPSDETGLASGIYITGMGLGMTVGLFSGDLFPSWDFASLFFGGLALIVAVAWLILGKTAPEGAEMSRPPMFEGIKRGIKSRSIIGGTIALFFFIGGLTGFTHKLPYALEEVYNIPSGGVITSLLTLGLVIGNVVLPAISDRIKRVNIIIIIGGILGGSIFYIGWILGDTSLIWFLFVLGGFFAGGIPPSIFEIPARIPNLQGENIETQHVSGTSGIMTSLQNFGGFFLPAYVLVPIISILNFQSYFLVCSIFIVIPAIAAILLIRETGEVEEVEDAV